MTEFKSEPITAQEQEIRQRVKEMRDGDLLDYIRDAVVRLDALADRLEVLVETGEVRKDLGA